jgi:hypothetical protein
MFMSDETRKLHLSRVAVISTVQTQNRFKIRNVPRDPKISNAGVLPYFERLDILDHSHPLSSFSATESFESDLKTVRVESVL